MAEIMSIHYWIMTIIMHGQTNLQALKLKCSKRIPEMVIQVDMLWLAE